ncbi:MAG: hypothetical protein RR248_00775 [Clostridia bacterium]
MKKITKALSIVLLFCLVFALASCGGLNQEAVKCTIIIGEETFAVETKTRTLHEALLELKENKIITTYEFTGTTFSPFVTKLCKLESSSQSRTFIALYHDIDDASLKLLDSITWQPITTLVNGKTYFSSNVGFALLPIVEGATYYIILATY